MLLRPKTNHTTQITIITNNQIPPHLRIPIPRSNTPNRPNLMNNANIVDYLFGAGIGDFL